MPRWSRSPTNLVLICALLLAGWIASGMLTRNHDDPEAADGARLQRVTVTPSSAQPTERRLTFQGQLDPAQTVTVRAETSGQIADLVAERGDRVEQGELLLKLDPGERVARIREQEAELARARRDFEANRALTSSGHTTELRVDAARAALRAAEANLDASRRDLARTRVNAPLDGILERRLAERGEWVSTGEALLELVDNDPLLAEVHVPQHLIGQIHQQMPARVRPIGHDAALEGTITYVSRVADPATRTFRVEVEVPNPDARLPAGTSARVVVPLEQVLAHRISPAIMGLDDQGQAGIKTVDTDNIVHFHPVSVVRADADGLWVSGLASEARIITAGAAFVTAGEEVAAELAEPMP